MIDFMIGFMIDFMIDFAHFYTGSGGVVINLFLTAPLQ
ncbi:hypothetical protein ESCO106031_26625 [Escherichia coli]|nr:hypothetical protein HmCmsJML108_00408 [Escherichia coli]